jgi:hypothetical protein
MNNFFEYYPLMGSIFLPGMFFLAILYITKGDKKTLLIIIKNICIYIIYSLSVYMYMVNFVANAGENYFGIILEVIFLSFLHIFIFGWWLVFRKQ